MQAACNNRVKVLQLVFSTWAATDLSVLDIALIRAARNTVLEPPGLVQKQSMCESS